MHGHPQCPPCRWGSGERMSSCAADGTSPPMPINTVVWLRISTSEKSTQEIGAVGQHLESKTFTLSTYKSEKRGTVVNSRWRGVNYASYGKYHTMEYGTQPEKVLWVCVMLEFTTQVYVKGSKNKTWCLNHIRKSTAKRGRQGGSAG